MLRFFVQTIGDQIKTDNEHGYGQELKASQG
jgi:hypothetical protein